jgi:hypothetical protein
MTQERVFDLAADKLEAHSDLDKLEARGTLRLALKSAGLDARTLSVPQLEVVMRKIMPGELERRGVWKPEQVCETVLAEVKSLAASGATTTETDPEAVFRRLGSD